jgi:hypothetical protein
MDVIFTSCATEAIEVYSRQLTVKALSILAVNCKLWTVNSLPKRHIVTSQVEHSSVLNYCMALEKAGYQTPLLGQEGYGGGRGLLGQEGCRGDSPKEDGYRVTCLPVDRDGLPLFCWFN